MKNTISNLMNRDRYLNIISQDQNMRRTRVVICPQVEEALVLWILPIQQKKINVSRAQIKEKGRRFFFRELDFQKIIFNFQIIG